MPLNATDLITLSRLLDEALELEPARAAAWLAALPEEHARLRPKLEEMLADHRADSHPAFMAEGPKSAAPDDGTVTRADDLVGSYRLIRKIGHGGMGTVWLAERADGTLKRHVALKLPRLAWGAGLAVRMARERDIGALLEHPNIARLYDAGVDALGRPYLALEYIDGQPIDAWCEAQALGVQARLRLFVQVARAVAYAHGRLVVHRDLKPSNVLVTPEGQAHLLDFGIAKLLHEAGEGEDQLTQEQGRVLTPHYASPEQVQGEPITVASDVYSLGVLLYELLTGRLPSDPRRKSLAALEEAILNEEPPLSSSIVPDLATAKQLRGELDAILAKALKRDPAQRYTTADAFAEDIERHLRGERVLAQPDSVGYRFTKTLKRHRFGFAAAGAILIAILGGAGVSLVQAKRANESAERARVVKEFVVDVFKVNDRGNPANNELRLLPAEVLLERGARLIEARFSGQTELQAELFGVVTRILLDMKSDQAALQYAQKHFDAVSAAGSPAELRAQGALLLAEALLANGQMNKAETVARLALAQTRSVESQVRAHLFVAESMYRTDRDQDCLVELDRIDRELQLKAPLSRLLIAGALYLRARTLTSTNHFDEARPLFEKAIAEALAAEGSNSRMASKIRFRLADQLARAGYVEPARTMYREVLVAMRAVGGEDDLEAALLEVDAVGTLAQSGSVLFAEADAAVTRTLKTIEQQGSRLPPWVRADVEATHGCLALRFGRTSQGMQLAERSTPVLRAFHQTSAGGGCLSFALMVSGRHEDAEAEFVNEIKRSTDSNAHSYVTLAFNRMMNGNFDHAHAALDSAPQFPAIRGASQAKAEWAAFSIRAARARIYVEQGSFAKAIEALQGLPDDTFMMNDVGFIRGEALCGLGQPLEASRQMRSRMMQTEDYRDGYEFNPWLASMRAKLGLCELAAGNRSEAIALAQLARHAFEGQPEVSRYYKVASMELSKRLAGVP